MEKIELRNNKTPHLLDIKTLGKEGIERIISAKRRENELNGGKVALLFFEDSTRTRLSFELAAKSLGCIVLSPNLHTSSIQKGETNLDTITTIAAMGVDQIVLRSSKSGFAAEAAQQLGKHCRILNAGDGTNQHPTQALTDLYILKNACPKNWSDMKVGITGNISHSRVANSLIDGLGLMGVNAIHLIGPQQWQPSAIPDIATPFENLEAGLADLDAIVVLRAQWERMKELPRQQITALQHEFRLEAKHVRLMNDGAIVMHPGPVLRDEEIDASILQHPYIKINDQVAAGVIIRERILAQNYS